ALFSSVTPLSSSDVWAVGSAGSQTLTEHWDGASWSRVPSPNPLPSSKGNNFLTGVTALSYNDVWAVGATLDFTLGGLEQTVTMKWNGVSWTVFDSRNQGRKSTALLGASSAVGGVVCAAGSLLGRETRSFAIQTTQGIAE